MRSALHHFTCICSHSHPSLRSHRMLHTGSRFTTAQEEIIPVCRHHYSWWCPCEHLSSLSLMVPLKVFSGTPAEPGRGQVLLCSCHHASSHTGHKNCESVCEPVPYRATGLLLLLPGLQGKACHGDLYNSRGPPFAQTKEWCSLTSQAAAYDNTRVFIAFQSPATEEDALASIHRWWKGPEEISVNVTPSLGTELSQLTSFPSNHFIRGSLHGAVSLKACMNLVA